MSIQRISTKTASAIDPTIERSIRAICRKINWYLSTNPVAIPIVGLINQSDAQFVLGILNERVNPLTMHGVLCQSKFGHAPPRRVELPSS